MCAIFVRVYVCAIHPQREKSPSALESCPPASNYLYTTSACICQSAQRAKYSYPTPHPHAKITSPKCSDYNRHTQASKLGTDATRGLCDSVVEHLCVCTLSLPAQLGSDYKVGAQRPTDSADDGCRAYNPGAPLTKLKLTGVVARTDMSPPYCTLAWGRQWDEITTSRISHWQTEERRKRKLTVHDSAAQHDRGDFKLRWISKTA